MRMVQAYKRTWNQRQSENKRRSTMLWQLKNLKFIVKFESVSREYSEWGSVK